MKISVTGHRPNKLPGFGYDYSSEKWQKTIRIFQDFLKEQHCEEALTGMALGTDTAFALAVLELKKEGYPIQLHCAIPCLGHSSKWPYQSRKLYQDILDQADLVKLVTEAPYSPSVMQKRNEYLVDHADMLLAFWDEKPGGTKNCIEYAIKQNKPISYIKVSSI